MLYLLIFNYSVYRGDQSRQYRHPLTMTGNIID